MKIKYLLKISLLTVLLLSQGCWAENNKDITQKPAESIGSQSNRIFGNDYYDVCDFLLEKKRENSLKEIFSGTKPLRPGAFMFDISSYVKSGGGNAVIAESVTFQGAKYNFYMALSEVKLKENGLLDDSTILSDHRIEFQNSALFFFYKNSPYLLTKLSDLESDVRNNVYKLSNSTFEHACQ